MCGVRTLQQSLYTNERNFSLTIEVRLCEEADCVNTTAAFGIRWNTITNVGKSSCEEHIAMD